MKKVNFEVTEEWHVECPECQYLNEAPMNHDNPMQPMQIECEDCDEKFIVTYERD